MKKKKKEKPSENVKDIYLLQSNYWQFCFAAESQCLENSQYLVDIQHVFIELNKVIQLVSECRILIHNYQKIVTAQMSL